MIVHNLLISRAEIDLDLAQKIATKRSGQRGYIARQELITSENELAILKSQNPQTFITATMINEVMSEVFSAHEALDVEADEARAKTILRGLGFNDEDFGKEGKQIGILSGGWRMRVMLGKALYINPDILLLDEPSAHSIKKKQRQALIHLTPANHLDLTAIIWLQSYLTNETDGQTIVVVSHDRNFLDAVTEETIIFRNQKLTYHPGNYDDWERHTEEQRKRKTRLKEVCFFSDLFL